MKSRFSVQRILWRVIALLAAVTGIYFWIANDRTDLPESIEASEFDVHGRLGWTAFGPIEVYGKEIRDPRSGESTIELDEVVTSFAISPDGKFVGFSNGEGRLGILSDIGVVQSEQVLGDFVLGVLPINDREALVCHGSSGYSPDFRISHYRINDGLVEKESIETGFACVLFTGNNFWAAYATENAFIGLVSRNLDQHIRARWDENITAIAMGSVAGLLVGDRSGSIALFNDELALLDKVSLSKSAIVSVVVMDETYFAALDSQGRVFLGSIDGKDIRIRSVSGLSSVGAIELIRTMDGGLTFLSGGGQAYLISRSTLSEVVNSGNMRILFGTILVFSILILASSFISIQRLCDQVKAVLVDLWRNRFAVLMLVPCLLLVCLFVYYPVLSALGYAFTEFTLTSPAKFIGLENFVTMAKDPFVQTGMMNMFLFIVTGIIKIVTMPLLVAELVYWTSSRKLQQIYRTVFVIPGIIPGMIIILLWKMIYEPEYGLINEVLRKLGLEQWQHAWLGSESTALWAIIFHGFPWVNMLAFLVFLGALVRIDRNLFESVWIDGGGTLQRFWHVDLPFIKPQLKLLITLVMINSIQDVAAVLLFTGGGPGISTYTPALQMFYATTEEGSMGYASAIGVLLFVLVLIATFMVNKLLGKSHE